MQIVATRWLGAHHYFEVLKQIQNRWFELDRITLMRIAKEAL